MNNTIINEYIIFLLKIITTIVIPITILTIIFTQRKKNINKNISIENINENLINIIK